MVKLPTLDFDSGHDLTVCEFEPRIGFCTDRAEPAGDSLSLPLSLPLPTPRAGPLSLSQNKFFLKKGTLWTQISDVILSVCFLCDEPVFIFALFI